MLKNDDLVSIVMPAYNCEKYIVEAIESVLEQTYSNFELIVIDDASSDNTFKKINFFAEKDTRVKAFKNKKNLGVSGTRNKGVYIAESIWVAFLDSDDIWTEEKLEKQMSYAKKNRVNFVFTGASYIDEEGNPYSGVFEVPEEITYKKLLRQNFITCSSVLIKKKYFENIQMEKDDIHEDYAVWLRILKIGVKAYGLNEPLLIYRISKNSKSGHKIKSIKMTYKVYRFIEINPLRSAYFMARHVTASAGKYKRIFKKI